MYALQLGRQARVPPEELGELGRLVEDAEGVGLSLGGFLCRGGLGSGCGSGVVGRVVLFVWAEAGDRAAKSIRFSDHSSCLRDCLGFSYYGSEHLGHLYLASSFSHMPQSFGAGLACGTSSVSSAVLPGSAPASAGAAAASCVWSALSSGSAAAPSPSPVAWGASWASADMVVTAECKGGKVLICKIC